MAIRFQPSGKTTTNAKLVSMKIESFQGEYRWSLNKLDVKPQRGLRNLETLRPIVAPSLRSGATAQGLWVSKFRRPLWFDV